MSGITEPLNEAMGGATTFEIMNVLYNQMGVILDHEYQNQH